MKHSLSMTALILSLNLVITSLTLASAQTSDPKTYLCKSFDGATEVIMTEVLLGSIKTTHLKIESLKEIKTTYDQDVDGFAVKRTVSDNEIYYDLSSYSLRFNKKTKAIVLINYRSSGGTNSECRLK